MGTSHARAYHNMDGCEIVGVVSRGPESRGRLAGELGGATEYDDFRKALEATKPDAVCISTYPETHVDFAVASMEAGAHVFLEKPIAEDNEGAERVVAAARKHNKKAVIGYILRHHPAWTRFIETARTLGKPLVMRMNLNQQSSGDKWRGHKNLMNSLSPIVDCGVHYVDVMCQMTGARPIRVQAIGARLSDELKPGMYNYGNLQVVFDDGSVGWYEAGWGPMISEEAFFVKDVVGPRGCASIADRKKERGEGSSADIESHTATHSIRIHHADLDADGNFAKQDEWVDTTGEPDHDELCRREQEYFVKAIREDIDLTEHLTAAVDSLRIVLAADQSIREGKVISLE